MAKMTASDMMGQFAGRTSYGAPRVPNPTDTPQKPFNVRDGVAKVGGNAVLDMDGDGDGDVQAKSVGARTMLMTGGADSPHPQAGMVSPTADHVSMSNMMGRSSAPDHADMSDMMNPKVSRDY